MSIYDQIGGAAAVTAAVDDFYVRVLGDPDLAPFFENTDVAKLKGHQRAFIAAALGGPETYSGKAMGPAHAGMKITSVDFARVVDHLVATLKGLGLDEDTITAIGGKLAPLEAEIVNA